MTSHDVVDSIRRGYGKRRWKDRVKVGHAGTLDPFATGLLVVLVGSATRLQPYIVDQPKTYVATAKLGSRSTTGDPDGEVVETGHMPASLDLPTGEIEQLVPMTSAVRVDGERLYRKAHRGETVDRPTRRVRVDDCRILGQDPAERTVTYEIRCSAGTYVRSLIETLQDAYCQSLRRDAIGALQRPEEGQIELSPSQAMAHLPERELTEQEAAVVGNGQSVAGPDYPHGHLGDVPTMVRLTRHGELLAIGEPSGGQLRPRIVLV